MRSKTARRNRDPPPRPPPRERAPRDDAPGRDQPAGDGGFGAGGGGGGGFPSSFGGPSAGFRSSTAPAGGLQLHCSQLRLGQHWVATIWAPLVLGAGAKAASPAAVAGPAQGRSKHLVKHHTNRWTAAALLPAEVGAGVGGSHVGLPSSSGGPSIRVGLSTSIQRCVAYTAAGGLRLHCSQVRLDQEQVAVEAALVLGPGAVTASPAAVEGPAQASGPVLF